MFIMVRGYRSGRDARRGHVDEDASLGTALEKNGEQGSIVVLWHGLCVWPQRSGEQVATHTNERWRLRLEG